jgi:cardiolipin synthase
MSFDRVLRAVFLIPAFAILSSCSEQSISSTATMLAMPSLHGEVHGGQQPVLGASIQLYSVSTAGDSTTSTAMLSTPAVSTAGGAFSINGQYSCGSATQVYLVATGGMPDGINANPNLALMAALGPCSGLTSGTAINMNELTTVAAVGAIDLFMASDAMVGSSSYDAAALQQDFTLATQLVNTASGSAPGINLPSGDTAPVPLLNTLGNILAACINSAGGVAGDNSLCGSLFTLTTPPGGTAPTNTISALLNLLNHPTLNTTSLFKLITTDAPFQPQLPAAPADYAVQLTPPAFTVSRQFLVEPDDGVTALYTLLNNAQSSIDLTIYGLKDTIFSGDLVAACQRGVAVRVVMDQNDEKSVDQAAYTQINAQAGCRAVWANSSYPATHEKSFVVDNTTLAMLTLNLETTSYAGPRDFAVISNDPGDVAAFEATFSADYAQVHSYTTTPGTDLIWSPTTAQTSLVGIMNNATVSLAVENEEMSGPKEVAALEAACQRGVAVSITMTAQSSYDSEFSALEAAGCGVHVLKDSTKVLYIHAKVILADYGTTAQYAYVGSINFSTASTVENRELGLYLYDSSALQRLSTTLAADYASATAY